MPPPIAPFDDAFNPLNAEPHVPERVIGRRRRFRSVWISDVHLGTRGCNAAMLIDFFDHVDCQTMYLVGDIIDGWRLKQRHYWPPEHNDVVWRVLKRAKRGTRVIYIPGNHDEMLRPFCGLNFGGVEIMREAIHVTSDGKRFLVLHGDEFDAIMLSQRWLALIGDATYTALLRLNTIVNQMRRALGLPYFSLSKMAKHKVKNAVQFIGRYEETVARAARQRHVDGVVCGHIHNAEIRRIGDIIYHNDGDWVEGCNALVEHHDGTMEILNWAEEMAMRTTTPHIVHTADDTLVAA